MCKIKVLPDHLANQIAAGEVVERPASVVKELVENALDAQATEVEIIIEGAGMGRIVVRDNGIGMAAADIPIAMQRHATSKIADVEDLFAINSFGFRGEALPSIASVSRFSITSATEASEHGWCCAVEGGSAPKQTPAAHPRGTTIEVKDLFYNTPARRKFMKAHRTEMEHINDVVVRLALAHPQTVFKLVVDGSATLHFGSAQGQLLADTLPRLATFMGQDFVDNAVEVDAAREDMYVRGFVSLPTFHLSTNRRQYLFVNGRPVKDKVLLGAVKQAYHDMLHHGRHPACVLFLEVPADMVDVNVHPAKAEVRFRQGNNVFGLILSAVRQALEQNSKTAAHTSEAVALNAFKAPELNAPFSNMQTSAMATPYHGVIPAQRSVQSSFFNRPQGVEEGTLAHTPMAPLPPLARDFSANINAAPVEVADLKDHPLGAAVAQVHSTYIVSQTAEGLVVVDQHAAHERIVYEKMKTQVLDGTVESQKLLIPEVVEVGQTDAESLAERAEDLLKFGLDIEQFGPSAVAVRATPALLGSTNAKELVLDLVEDLREMKQETSLQNRLEELLATMACHGSIRSGRKMDAREMNQLLRDMEITPKSGQCNHGRPTYIKLALKDIEKLFNRRGF